MAKGNRPQRLPLGDSYLNLIVGIIVVVAIAALVIGLIRSRSLPTGDTTKDQAAMESATPSGLPTNHTVAEGEDLWKISEKYYKTGYNWVDIAKENNIANPNDIAAGMELAIPNVTPMVSPTQGQMTPDAEATPEPTGTPDPTVTDSQPTPPAEQTQPAQPTEGAITGNSYTVVMGDYLWSIAIRAYGDGYKWIEIARANKLDNPDVIHPGNVLTLPR